MAVPLEARVAVEVGVFVQRVASLELDLADVILLSLEKLPENGSELRDKWPYSVSQKLDVLPTLIKELGLSIRNDMNVLNSNEFSKLFEFRNTVCHGKIVHLQGSERFFSGKIVKVSLGDPRSGDKRQRLVRREFGFSSDALRQASKLASLMIEEVEEVRKCVLSLFSGWPTYNFSFLRGSICDVEFRH
jgi:hypothetical protein